MDAKPWMPEIDFSDEVITPICRRPRMYTADGTFHQVVAFLEGFGLGANVGDQHYHSVFTPFHKWLAKREGRREPTGGFWGDFRARYSSDDEAIDSVAKLYAEYAHSVEEARS